MSTDRQLNLDAGDGVKPSELEELKAAFGIRPDQAIDTAAKRLHAWALAAIESTGASNMVRVDQVLYSWDTTPRRLQNGAVQGRIQAQRRGELWRDVGGFKIDAGGRVVQLPAALREVLPGGLEAAAGDEEGSGHDC